MEYFSHEPSSVTYRGHNDVLFKRDFGKFYIDNFPDLKVVSYGFIWQKEFSCFDNINWWLFEKTH